MSMGGRITLLKRWMRICSGKNRVAVAQGIGKAYSRTEVSGYYNDLTGKVNEKTLLDPNGITVNVIEGNRRVYFPISIFQYALGLWDLYLMNPEAERKEQFLRNAQWILENQRNDGSWDCFTPLGYTRYSVSSMGQGEAISVLLRAYKLTGSDIWLKSAKMAMQFMILPLEQGGTLLIKENDLFFEEYPDAQGGKRGVLNGWIFSLFGIYDYLLVVEDETVQRIFNQSIRTLKRELPGYDMGYWSYYDRTKRIASPAYHALHSSLLRVLGDLTGEKAFLYTAEKWEMYAHSGKNRGRAIVKKAIQKLRERPEGIIIQ